MLRNGQSESLVVFVVAVVVFLAIGLASDLTSLISCISINLIVSFAGNSYLISVIPDEFKEQPISLWERAWPAFMISTIAMTLAHLCRRLWMRYRKVEDVQPS